MNPQRSVPSILNLRVPGGANSHQFHGSVASFGRPSPWRPQPATEGLEVDIGERVSPRHLVLSSSPVWLPKRGERARATKRSGRAEDARGRRPRGSQAGRRPAGGPRSSRSTAQVRTRMAPQQGRIWALDGKDLYVVRGTAKTTRGCRVNRIYTEGDTHGPSHLVGQ